MIGESPAAAPPAYGGHGGVSHKIQQLLNTLKRPRKNRRPVEEYYHDDEAPGENARSPPRLANAPDNLLLIPPASSAEDPNAPHPVGPTMQPAVGVPLESRQDWHRNLEAAIQHHSTTLAKHPAISVVEPNGKVQVQANYSESQSRTSLRGFMHCIIIQWPQG